eukprot:UC4_evm1s1026
MCSGCGPAAVTGTFTSPQGNTKSWSGTVACGDSATYGGSPFDCLAIDYEDCVGDCTKCQAIGSVTCSRTADGNLVAQVNYASCHISGPVAKTE